MKKNPYNRHAACALFFFLYLPLQEAKEKKCRAFLVHNVAQPGNKRLLHGLTQLSHLSLVRRLYAINVSEHGSKRKKAHYLIPKLDSAYGNRGEKNAHTQRVCTVCAHRTIGT